MTDTRDTPRVLFSFGPPTPEANPYTTLLGQTVADRTERSYFSWKAALVNRHDVLHVQWPESLVRPYQKSSTAPLARLVKTALASVMLVKCRLQGTKIVWTVHNRDPHETGPLSERLFIRLFHRLVDHRVYLNRGETDELGRPSTVILHPDYAPVVHDDDPTPARDSTLFFFGHLRPYKGVESLIDVVSAHPELGALAVAGNSADPAYGAALIARGARHDNVSVTVGLVPQDELDSRIRRARLVILPYTRVYNSGSILLALTLGAPVLVRASETTRSLADEVGPGWVTVFDGDLDAATITRALEASAGLGTQRPDLSARSWVECATRHVDLYRRLSN